MKYGGPWITLDLHPGCHKRTAKERLAATNLHTP
jgi:hypothetical protein